MTRAGRTIALMGLDGTGKSTQASYLAGKWREEGARVIVIHHASTKVPGVAQIKRRIHGKVVAALAARSAPSDRNDAAREPSKSGRLFSLPFAWWLLWGSFVKSWWYHLRYRRINTLLDRSFLDDVVKVRWRLGAGRALAGALLPAVPRPDLVIVLEGDPQVTFQRKKQMNCAYPEYLEKGRILDQVLLEARRQGWKIERVEIADRTADEVGRMLVDLLPGSAGGS